MHEPEHVRPEAEPDAQAAFDHETARAADQAACATQPETDPARRARVAQAILGRVAAFGRFAFSRPTPRQPRHADTWRDKGPHENTGAAARRMRQMERQRLKAIRKQGDLESPRCPNCGGDIERDMVDVGVGEVPVGPCGCPSCHWVEDRRDTA